MVGSGDDNVLYWPPALIVAGYYWFNIHMPVVVYWVSRGKKEKGKRKTVWVRVYLVCVYRGLAQKDQKKNSFRCSSSGQKTASRTLGDVFDGKKKLMYLLAIHLLAILCAEVLASASRCPIPEGDWASLRLHRYNIDQLKKRSRKVPFFNFYIFSAGAGVAHTHTHTHHTTTYLIRSNESTLNIYIYGGQWTLFATHLDQK